MPRSVMEHSFANVPSINIPRSSFNRSHGLKTTFDADYLIPVLVDEVVPGDTFNVNMNFFARLATPLYPIMDNLYLESFFFFVPARILWDNWKKMHGEQDNPADSIDFTVPIMNTSTPGFVEGSLSDYFGLPTGRIGFEVSALPYRAYNLIYKDWFRDQNLQDEPFIYTGDAAQALTLYPLVKRNKRHDYFTSCLPWPQKGDAVDLPLGLTAPVMTDAAINARVTIIESGGGLNHAITTDHPGGEALVDSATYVTGSELYADLSTATAATINDLRLAFQTQRLLERDARSGTRYNELILAHFGVTVPDFRIQRPEFLGGGSTPISINAVAQTSGQPVPAANDKLGELAAYGTAGGRHGFTKSFVEHGVILGLVNVRADITYSQGIERFWSKATRYDFYYPVLAQIGEQSVLSKEIYCTVGTKVPANDDAVFGYQERYAEYRYKPSKLTSLMRPEATASLEAWHLSEEFSSRPTLGDTFIQSNTGAPLDRAIAISTEPHIIFDAYFDMQCARPMPLHGVPGNLDHF